MTAATLISVTNLTKGNYMKHVSEFAQEVIRIESETQGDTEQNEPETLAEVFPIEAARNKRAARRAEAARDKARRYSE